MVQPAWVLALLPTAEARSSHTGSILGEEARAGAPSGHTPAGQAAHRRIWNGLDRGGRRPGRPLASSAPLLSSAAAAAASRAAAPLPRGPRRSAAAAAAGRRGRGEQAAEPPAGPVEPEGDVAPPRGAGLLGRAAVTDSESGSGLMREGRGALQRAGAGETAPTPASPSFKARASAPQTCPARSRP